MDQNTQPTTEPTQNYFAQSTPPAEATPPAPTPEQVAPVAPAQPPKKSRRGLWIILSIVAVIVAAAVAALVYVSSQTAQANTAAKDYKTEVVSYLDSLLNAETTQKRVELLEKPVTLKEVALGDTFSSDYKKATELKKEYDAYVEKSLPIMRQRASTQDLSPFFNEFADFTATKITTDMPEITDEASAKRATATITNLKDRGEQFLKFSQRFEGYTFAPEYQEDQKTYAQGIKVSGQKWLELASIQQTVASKQIEILEAREKGDTAAAQKGTTELEALVQTSTTRMQAITTEYGEAGKAMSTALNSFLKKIGDSGYIPKVAMEAAGVGEATTALREKFAN